RRGGRVPAERFERRVRRGGVETAHVQRRAVDRRLQRGSRDADRREDGELRHAGVEDANRAAGRAQLTEFGSTDAITLPADGLWHPVTFDLTPAAMTNIFGTDDTLATALGAVNELRILSGSFG